MQAKAHSALRWLPRSPPRSVGLWPAPL